MSVSAVKVSGFGKCKRIDAEYYQPHQLNAERQLDEIGWKVSPLGDLVKEGYRVVYENTFISEEPFDPMAHAKFLQAADISSGFPVINYDSIGWVGIDDWIRYPKGRIRRGEILVEVKGKAEKVALVPDDFPEDCLVTGTLYKMLVDKDKVTPEYILVYFLSKFGCNFRDRVKTNTLISYVSKEELYDIPIPIAPRPIQAAITAKYQQAYRQYKQSEQLYAEAERLLSAELGLDRLDLPAEDVTTRRLSDILNVRRIDAEYFHPQKAFVQEWLGNFPGKAIGEYFKPVREIYHPPAFDTGKSILNFDLTDALRYFVDDDGEMTPENEIGSIKKWLKRGDVIVSRLRSYLKEIAYVNVPQGVDAVGSSEFIVLRQLRKDVHPELLIVYLLGKPVQTILKWSQDGSNHPRFQENELLAIRLPDKALKLQDEIRRMVQSGIQANKDAKRLLSEAKGEVERLIEG